MDKAALPRLHFTALRRYDAATGVGDAIAILVLVRRGPVNVQSTTPQNKTSLRVISGGLVYGNSNSCLGRLAPLRSGQASVRVAVSAPEQVRPFLHRLEASQLRNRLIVLPLGNGSPGDAKEGGDCRVVSEGLPKVSLGQVNAHELSTLRPLSVNVKHPKQDGR